nr:restriction endonuclease subunit S [Halomonas sp. UBA1491]
MSARELITEHLELWTGAVTKKSSSGRGSRGKVELTGVKKLRELILELAVRGQLVPQSPEDTSFRELVLQLREDHAPTKTRGRKTVSGEVSEDEKPFNIPKTWVWTRLGEIVDVLDSQRKPITKAARKSGPYPYYGASGIVDHVDGYLFDESLVLVGEDGAKWDKGEGTAFSISGKTWVNNHAHVLRPRREAVTDDYLVYFLTAADLNPYITGMTVPKLNQARLSSIPIATPNLEEQHRIVQKVDELMALCDRLEKQTSDQLEAHETLVDTLLGTLTQSENATELADNWARLAAHFDTLFTTEQSIDKLKQTVLQLAVMGRLVEQDAEDEPASDLIQRINQERLKLEGEGKVRAVKKTARAGVVEPLPGKWAKCSLGTCISLISGQHLKGDEYFDDKRPESVPYLTGPAEFGARTPEPQRYTFERRAVAEKGDILITCKGSGVGKLNTASEEIAISRQLMAARPILINARFLYLLLDSLRDAIREKTVGIAIPGISRGDILEASIQLPPLEEQHRIVQKVDELMALCDQLKQRLNQASETRCQLAEAVVEGALN